jgi:hypothetical protein
MKLALLGMTLAATTNVALAQTYPAAAPAPQPVAADPDISQINGQLVPVGQHNEYRYSYKRWNISSNPIGWIAGLYGVSLSYGISQNLAIRGDVNYFSPIEQEGVTGFEIGVGLPIYFRRTYQGAFLEPGFISRHFEDSRYDEAGSTTFGPQVLFGWHWMWDSGLNIAVAVGMGRNWATEDTDSEYDNEKLFANGYFRVGYAF